MEMILEKLVLDMLLWNKNHNYLIIRSCNTETVLIIINKKAILPLRREKTIMS